MRRHRLFHTPEGRVLVTLGEARRRRPTPADQPRLVPRVFSRPMRGRKPERWPARARPGPVRSCPSRPSSRPRRWHRPGPSGRHRETLPLGLGRPDAPRLRWSMSSRSPAWGPHVRDRHERGARRHPHDSQAPRPPDRAPDALPPRPASRGSVTSPTAGLRGPSGTGPSLGYARTRPPKPHPDPRRAGPGRRSRNFLDSRFVRTVFGLRRVLRPSAFVPAMPAGVKVEDPRASYRDTISF